METSNHINKTSIEHDKVFIESESQTTQTTQTLELSSFQRAQKKYKQKPEVIEKNTKKNLHSSFFKITILVIINYV